MGACCSCQRGQNSESLFVHQDEVEVEEEEELEAGVILGGDLGARVRHQGSSRFVSMFTQQGKKGANQDAMTVWENFTGEREMMFCGVFDGHGPYGHKVAQYVRDLLPSKLSSSTEKSSISGSVVAAADDEDNNDGDQGDDCNNATENGAPHDDEEWAKNPFYSTWKSRILSSFKDMDEELESDPSIDSYGSGTTAVTAFKKDEHLIIANLGDSRAVLCTRNDRNQLIAEQLTVDLKPDLPNEAKRIKSCQGRVMSMEEEPHVYRVWMPDEDCPGLAMARAFGDFCLKDFGLISTPQLFYRKLTDKDEFVVLATDGVWDVLPNNEVAAVVASAKKRSLAAKMVVERAVRAWRYKYPCAKVDDCAVVCIFFKKQRPLLTKSVSEVTQLSKNYSEMGGQRHGMSKNADDGLDTLLNYNPKEESSGNRPRRHHSVQNRRKFEFVES